MSARHICLICHNEIPHPGAECPHCKGEAAARVGVTPQLLVLIFAVMFLFFVTTGFLTRSFRQERRSRGQQHYQLAQTLSDYGYHADAIQEYRDALTYQPSSLDSRLGLAQSLYSLGRYNEAETHLIDLRKSDPTWAVVNRLLGRIAARRGAVDAAVNYYQTAIYGRWDRSPAENRIRARLELVDLLRRHPESGQLVGQLLELLDEAPRDSDLRKRIGWLLLEAASDVNARDVFEQEVRRTRDDGEAHAGLGEAEFALGNYVSAQNSLEAAIRFGHDSEEVSGLLDLTRKILELNPTTRGIGRRTSLRRSQQLVERTVAAVEQCLNPGPEFVGPPAPPPPAVDPWLGKARDLLAQQRRQSASEETIEANILFAEGLWNSSRDACRDTKLSDAALAHVLSDLSR